MKKLLSLLLGSLALCLLASCVAPGGYNTYGVNAGIAPNYQTSAGIIATSNSRWGWDPYYRSYYDFSLGQYYNTSRRRYYSSLPTRYSSPFYPVGYLSLIHI